MRNRKRSILTHLVYLFIALMFILGLTGCVDNAGNVLSPGDVGLSTEGEEVIITFAYDESYRTLVEPLMDAFHEENPSITVRFVPLSATNYSQAETVEDRLLALATSADTTLTSIRFSALGSYFLDLQPLIDADSSFDQADFWTGSLSAEEDSQSRILGLPVTLFLRGIFYDKAAFDAANLSYPQPGWTWEDFRQMTALLNQTQAGGIRYGYADRSTLSILQPLIGYELELNDGQIDAGALANDLDWYVQMAREDQLLPLVGDDWQMLFETGNSPAMWYGSLFEFILGAVTGDEEATDLKVYFDDSAYGFAPFPVDADGENVNTTPVSALSGVISAGSEHPVEAWKWLNFLSQHWLVSDQNYASSQLNIPARRSVAEAEGYWGYFPEDVQTVMQYGLEHGWYNRGYSQAEEAILTAVGEAAAGQTDLSSALQEAETEQASWPQEEQAPPEIVVATPQPPQDPSQEVSTIHFYYTGWTTKQEAAIKSSINYFNQDHEGEIIVEPSNTYPPSDGAGFYEWIGENYDCYLSQLDPEGAVLSGAVLDLTALMEAEDIVFQQDFDATVLNSARYEGQQMALPLASLPAVVVYNADLLEQNGLEPPSLDWTFNDFLTYITAVTSSSGTEIVYGFLTTSSSVGTTDMFYAGRGVQWKDTSGVAPLVFFDTPEMADMLVWLNELEQSGVTYGGDSGNDWWGSITDVVQSGRVGFWTSNAGEESSEYVRSGKLNYTIGIAPLPYVSKPNGSIGSIDQLGFYISNASENSQACWVLGKYLTEQANVLNGIPARTSVANSPEWVAKIGAENIEVYQKSIENSLMDVAEDPYSNYFWFPINDWRWEAEVAVSDQNDSNQVLAEAQQKSDAYLECMSDYDVLNLDRDELWATAKSCAAQADPNLQYQ